MKNIFGAAILIAAIPALYPAAAQAQTTSSSYWSLGGGIIGESDFDYDIPGGSVTADTDAGFGVNLAYGRQFSPHWRGEVELGWTQADIDIVRRTGGPQILIFEEPGTVTSYSLGANVYYDFVTSGAIQPYVGAGIGLASLDVNDRIIRSAETAWKGQLMAGARFPMSERTSLFVEGRYETHAMNVEDGVGFSNAGSDLRTETVGVYAGLKFGF